MAERPLNVLTHSSTKTLRRCPREYWFSYIRGWRPDRPSQPLRMGAAFHLGLEKLSEGQSLQTALSHALEGYQSRPPFADEQAWNNETATVWAMLEGWEWRWSEVEQYIKTLGSELIFKEPLKDPDTGRKINKTELWGKTDRVIRLSDGRVALMEHKTAGESIDQNADYWTTLKIDPQISLYTIAIGCDTCIYDVTRKPSLRARKLTKQEIDRWDGSWYGHWVGGGAPERESVVMLKSRMVAAMKDDPDRYFQRREEPRLVHEMDLARGNLRDTAWQLRCYKRTGIWPRNPDQCITQRRTCPYLNICADPPDQVPEGFIELEDVHPELSRG